MKNFYEETGGNGLREMLELLGAEHEAFVRFADDGHVTSITKSASSLLKIGTMESIFEVFSAEEAENLRKGSAEAGGCSFLKRIDGRLYDVTGCRSGEETVLLLRARRRQPLLHAILSVRTANSLGNILYQTRSLQHEVKKLQASGGAAEDTLLDADRKFENVQRDVLRIKRLMQHAEWLEEAEIYGAKPVYVFADAAECCREVAEAFSAAAGKSVEVCAPKKLEAVFDPAWMKSALLNLLTNARNAEHIRVSAVRQKDTIILSVEDDGDGAFASRLRELYTGWSREMSDLDGYFLNRQGEAQPGTGLPVVQLVAQAHEGILLYEPVSPQGSAFRICFPNSLLAENMGIRSDYLSEGFSMEEIELSLL